MQTTTLELNFTERRKFEECEDEKHGQNKKILKFTVQTKLVRVISDTKFFWLLYDSDSTFEGQREMSLILNPIRAGVVGCRQLAFKATARAR